MRIILTGLALALCATAQPASAAWRYAPHATSPWGPAYWSTDVRRNGDEATFDSIEVYKLNAAADGVLVRRQTYRVDCAWGVGRSGVAGMLRPVWLDTPPDPPKHWDRAMFLGDPRDPDTVAGFACAAARPGALSDQPTLAAAVKDGIRRQGYADVEAVYRIDTPPPLPIPPYRRMEDVPPGYDPSGPLDLIWTGEARGVFVSAWSVRREGDKATGVSIWVTGVGRPVEERVYLLRDFAVDCRTGALAHSTRESWPRREGWPKGDPMPLRGATRAAGSPEDALVAVACGARQALRQIRSTGELPGFAAGTN